MKNELLHIGPVTIYGYGLMIALGIIAAVFLTDYLCKKKKLDADAMFWLVIWAVVGGMVGAKLLFYITRLGQIIEDPHMIIENLRSGWVVYGGIIGGLFGCWLYCRYKKIRFSEYLDVAMPAVALAQGFGRIGCLFSGCCYGIETASKFSITFTDSSYGPNNVALFPAQPVSAALNLIHCAILLLALTKFKKHGRVVGLYLTLYSIGRFIIEFYRGDLERGNVGVLSTSQFISLFMVVIGGALVYFGCEWIDVKAAGEEKAEDAEEKEEEPKAEDAKEKE